MLERFLYRLSRSRYADSFMLKGAMLFAVWEAEPHRPTRDIDLLGLGEDSSERLVSILADVCTAEVLEDGAIFDAARIGVREIRGGDARGRRARVRARLGNARLSVQVDVGFGDLVVPHGQPVELPTLLDFPAPRLRVYPVEAVIAEKLHAMAEHGMLSSRMKDIYDAVALAERLEFDGSRLCAAVRATFESRGRPAGEIPAPLTEEFAADAGALARWNAFMRRNRLSALDLATAVERARAFLLEPLAALLADEAFAKHWSPGGPWQ
ncbi:MAG TPA: nucleotidyl transferase AbiEii/AbiGii toxin family protein [Thermoleophilia bacterium]|nr:nucleotidyl transferase AbiEii/AbiGii toxin family protein [Thermoleophilia bacterium]